MIKPSAISGFPEWLPQEKYYEQQILDRIRKVYELHGYTPLETAAVEKLKILASKGVVDKELFLLNRHGEQSSSKELALHFDLTVPLARYVAQNYGKLTFPFKRYQIQKVWRGERPQKGRFREFYQADIDCVMENELPVYYEAQMPRIIQEIMNSLDIQAQIQVSHRKILIGYYLGLEITQEQIPHLLREVDKLDKIGKEKVQELLHKQGLSQEKAEQSLELAHIKGSFSEVQPKLQALSQHPLFLEGLQELQEFDSYLSDLSPQQLTYNFAIARGLDYYTGAILETFVIGHEKWGSVCSGGRYDDLASNFIKRNLPGVGVSIGLSRLIHLLLETQKPDLSRQSPSQVLLALPSQEDLLKVDQIAQELRSQGYPCEIYHQSQALNKQIRYADRKGIPFILFPHRYTRQEPLVELKRLADGEQKELPLDSKELQLFLES